MQQLESDIVVISAGTAGLAATVTAAEAGARVIVFEKLAHTGGTGNVGSMVIGTGSSLQKRNGINVTSGEVWRNHMDYTHWRADARLVKAFYDKSGSTIDWLEKLGVQFRDMGQMPMGRTGFQVTHGVIGGSYSMMKVLANRARELGVQIFLRTPVREIIKEGNRVTGVIAQNVLNQEEYRAKAKAVIIATGGFGSNTEMIKKYTGFEWGKDLFSFKMPGTTGDGIRMAWEIGAAPSEMMMQLVFSLPIPYHGAMGTSSEFMILSRPNLMVNLLGERFINEEIISNTTFGGNAIARQKGRCGFMIIDEDTRKALEAEPSPFPGGPPRGSGGRNLSMPPDLEAFLRETHLDFVFEKQAADKPGDLAVSIKAARDKGYKYLFMANSLEELSEQTGIELDGLKKTVEEYNNFCAKGHDDIFEKDPKHLRPIKKPPFYAAQFFPAAYGTLGGIRVNYKMEVLDNEYHPIPGLYAAGTDVAAIYGDSYTRHLGGNTQGFCINSGRMAGESAAAFVKTIH